MSKNQIKRYNVEVANYDWDLTTEEDEDRDGKYIKVDDLIKEIGHLRTPITKKMLYELLGQHHGP